MKTYKYFFYKFKSFSIAPFWRFNFNISKISEISYCWVFNYYGHYWAWTYNLNELMADKNMEKVQRVTQAMPKMKKIDIKLLEEV